jgi:DNA-binding NarL/FixJ family response regulator
MTYFQNIQVAIRHHDPLIAMGLSAALEHEPGIEVCAKREDDSLGNADVVVADLEAALSLQRFRICAGPGRTTRVVTVAYRPRESEVRDALQSGVHGFLLLDDGLQELVTCVRSVAHGQKHVSSKVAECMAESFSHEALTQRESTVLCLVAKGYPNKSIANELEISVGTVKTHVRAILGKLNARTRTHAAAVAADRGLVR